MLALVFDLESDPQERYNLTNWRMDMGFMLHVFLPIIIEYELSIVEYPNVAPGAEDFKGYHGAEHAADAEKAKLGLQQLMSGPKPEMGPAPQSPAQARGLVRAG